jgi:hypothetical protein
MTIYANIAIKQRVSKDLGWKRKFILGIRFLCPAFKITILEHWVGDAYHEYCKDKQDAWSQQKVDTEKLPGCPHMTLSDWTKD